MKKVFIISLFTGILFIKADRGPIPFKPWVKIFEPNQKALICWNGKEELMVLTTDLHASEETQILEVLPLPSKPEVKKGNKEVFEKCIELINRRLRMYPPPTRGKSITTAKKAAELVFHKTIGAHDISVTKVLHKKGFIDWVENYLKSQGVKNPEIPQELKNTIEDYLSEGFKWFVFDVVTVKKETKSIVPIIYKFKTDYLYFPLKITAIAEGNTQIDLLVISHKLLSTFTGYPIEKVKLMHSPIELTSEDLYYIDKEICKLMENKSAKLRIWKIEDNLKNFKEDLIAK